MASHRIETYCQRLAFPIGALIFSRAVDRLVRAGRLDPIPYFRRHTRGDWGDVNVPPRVRIVVASIDSKEWGR